MSRRHDLAGGYRVRRMSAIRRISVDSFDAIPSGHPMMALCEFDVTDVRRALREQRAAGRHVSFFAHVVKAIATTLAEDTGFNAMRRGRRIVEFDDVDINIAVESETEGEKLPRQITIRRAADKSVDDIWAEVAAAKRSQARAGVLGREDAWVLRLAGTMGHVPKPVRNLALRLAAADPFRVKALSGTTLVTSVGSFGDVPGFAIPYLRSPRAVSFAIGTVCRRPTVVGDGELAAREIMSMTLVFNHDIVDGAPAARFVGRLRDHVEAAS